MTFTVEATVRAFLAKRDTEVTLSCNSSLSDSSERLYSLGKEAFSASSLDELDIANTGEAATELASSWVALTGEAATGLTSSWTTSTGAVWAATPKEPIKYITKKNSLIMNFTLLV
jgi:hypothetical protein